MVSHEHCLSVLVTRRHEGGNGLDLANRRAAKLEAVTALVSKLTDDLKSRKLSTQGGCLFK